MMFKNIAVGISGGVDSAVTAVLLKQCGYNVTGVFMKNWDDVEEFGVCSMSQDIKDAEYICNKINIDLKQVNFVKHYWNDVFMQLTNDYQNGLTPNPDILCNKFIKFDLFHKFVVDIMKYDAMATGHYAKTSFGCYLQNYQHNNHVKLLKSVDEFKDQTFFLSQVPQSALSKTMFPLGDYYKNEVKEMAVQFGLEKIVKKRESVGICFIGRRNFQQFISNYLPMKQGNIVDLVTGNVLGQHNGLHMWTIGQKCPLGTTPLPLYVVKKDVDNNSLYVTKGKNHPSLFSSILYTEQPYFIDSEYVFYSGDVLECEFRFQHTKPLLKCLVYCLNDKTCMLQLKYPLKALTPGQYAVLYTGNECLGSARITSVGPSYFSLGLIVPKASSYFDQQVKPLEPRRTVVVTSVK